MKRINIMDSKATYSFNEPFALDADSGSSTCLYYVLEEANSVLLC